MSRRAYLEDGLIQEQEKKGLVRRLNRIVAAAQFSFYSIKQLYKAAWRTF